MVIDSILPHAEFEPKGHREDPPHFKGQIRTQLEFLYALHPLEKRETRNRVECDSFILTFQFECSIFKTFSVIITSYLQRNSSFLFLEWCQLDHFAIGEIYFYPFK